MDGQRTTYLYVPLDKTKREIRLLHLLPKRKVEDVTASSQEPEDVADVKTEDDGIRCTFSLASLEAPPPFEALSYVWGDPNDTMPINLEGNLFAITRNLHSALTHLRSDYQERILWADALCINQGDDDERTSQVAQMRYIYTLASTVVVFLGETWDGCDAAMDSIEMIVDDPNLHFDPLLSPHAISHGMSFDSETLRDHVIYFFVLPWWTRLWAVQEYVLAQQVILQCGRRWLRESRLSKFIGSWYTHGQNCCRNYSGFKRRSIFHNLSVSDGVDKAESLRNYRENKTSRDLISIAADFRTRQSYDPRDKIYGMLGLATGELAEVIQPDYNRSAKELFENVLLASIESTRSLDVLSDVYGDQTSGLDLPSFVPDWTAFVDESWHKHYMSRYHTLPHFNSSKGSQAELSSTAPGEVMTKGIFVDTISQIEDLKFPGWAQRVNRCRELAKINDNSEAPYSSRTTAFWQTLCGGMIPYMEDSVTKVRPVEDKDHPAYQNWQAWFDSSFSPSFFLTGVNDFHEGFGVAVAGRSFFITEKGYIGYAPERSAKGDLVAVLPGGKVPYVLRPLAEPAGEKETLGSGNLTVPPTSRHYAFLGDAYVHGIMHGEGFDGTKLEMITLM